MTRAVLSIGSNLGDREALLVEGAADDHALDVVEPEAGEGSQVVERSDASGVDELSLGCSGHVTKGVQVGSLHQPVDIDRRVDEAPHAPARELGDHLGRLQVGALRPALRSHLPRA